MRLIVDCGRKGKIYEDMTYRQYSWRWYGGGHSGNAVAKVWSTYRTGAMLSVVVRVRKFISESFCTESEPASESVIFEAFVSACSMFADVSASSDTLVATFSVDGRVWVRLDGNTVSIMVATPHDTVTADVKLHSIDEVYRIATMIATLGGEQR